MSQRARKRFVRTRRYSPYLYSFKEFAEKHKSFSLEALRKLRFMSKPRNSSLGVIPGNGLATAFVEVGSRVYIDERMFFHLLKSNKGTTTNSTLIGGDE